MSECNKEPTWGEELSKYEKSFDKRCDRSELNPLPSSAASISLEAKIGHTWKTIIIERGVPLELVDETMEHMEAFGDRQYDRHEKRRVRRIS